MCLIVVLASKCWQVPCIIQLIYAFTVLKEQFTILRPEGKLRRKLLSFLCPHLSLSFQQEILEKVFLFILKVCPCQQIATLYNIVAKAMSRWCSEREKMWCVQTERWGDRLTVRAPGFSAVGKFNCLVQVVMLAAAPSVLVELSREDFSSHITLFGTV